MEKTTGISSFLSWGERRKGYIGKRDEFFRGKSVIPTPREGRRMVPCVERKGEESGRLGNGRYTGT